MSPISEYDSVSSCTVPLIREIDPHSPHFRINVTVKGQNHQEETAAMIDSGATALFIGHDFARTQQVRTFALRKPIEVYNIDGTLNRAGSISRFAQLELTVGPTKRYMDFLVTDLGGEKIILGLPWLRKMNPQIDWTQGQVKLPRPTIEEVPDEEGPHTLSTLTVEENPVPDPDITPIPEPHSEPETDTGLNYTPLVSYFLPNLPEEDETSPITCIRANRRLRCQWLRAGTIEDTTEKVWCAAGFTYSQQLAEATH